MWDASADGYTRGEGFSAIFLKTLSRAIADGDHIESIVRETGVNSDGKTPGTLFFFFSHSHRVSLLIINRHYYAQLRVSSQTHPRHIRSMWS